MKNNKKGFTIVELVIVIAVIAILAAVLIPTFSSVTQSAKESAAMQQAKSGLSAVLALTGGSMPSGTIFAVTDDDDAEADYWYEYKNNKLQNVEIGKHTQKLNGAFCVYVSSKAIEEVGATKTLQKNTAELIAKALGLELLAEETRTLTGGGDYYTVTIGGEVVRVYYTTDIEDTMVILLGNDGADDADDADDVEPEVPEDNEDEGQGA